MRIVCLADIHGCLDRRLLPEGDVLVIAGDITIGPVSNRPYGRREVLDDLAALARRLRALPYTYKILVAGNHDGVLADNRGLRLLDGLIYLQDSGCVVDGIRFWGIPWTPTAFNDRAFCMSRHSLRLHYAAVPAGTDVLICHAKPPLHEIRHAAPRLVVFGHSATRPRWKAVQAGKAEIVFVCGCLDRSSRPIVADLSSLDPRVSIHEDPPGTSVT